MDLRRLWLVAPAIAGFLLAACAVDAPLEAEEATASLASGIVNGSLDTTHSPVVSIHRGTGRQHCTGAIVKVDAEAKVGYVLTAAHCVTTPVRNVRVGTNSISTSSARYEVIDQVIHPDYEKGGASGQPSDVAVLRIVADASTPVLPLIGSVDGLRVGETITNVGFGSTSEEGTSGNTTRRNFSVALSRVTTTHISYSRERGGACAGDSGSPVIARRDGKEYLVAVHSYGSSGGGERCGPESTGHAVRYRNVAGWVQSMLRRSPPSLSCNQCKTGAFVGGAVCAKMDRACDGDKACAGYTGCLEKCDADKPCEEACAVEFPLGVGPASAVMACSCNDACAKECASECTAVPRCGYDVTPARGASCGTCTESSCCAETKACAADGACHACLASGDKDPACATNAKRLALTSCQARSCADACPTAPPPEAKPVSDITSRDDAEDSAPVAPPEPEADASAGCSASGHMGAPGGSGLAFIAALGLASVARRRRR